MRFFSKIPIDKKQLEAAIARLELQTSAELRVYIERNLPHTIDEISAMERALQVFKSLEMHRTAQQNAVLIYLCYNRHLCAIIGDKGIHQFVSADFWTVECERLIQDFKQKNYTKGIISAIERIAEELIRYFPADTNNPNELPNEVIIHD